MTLDTYNYRNSLFDIIRLWFKKKRCRQCNGKLKRFTEKRLVREGATRFATGYSVRFGHGKEYDTEIKYRGRICGEVYAIDQL